MKKDIDFHPVTGIKLVIAREEDSGTEQWAVYVINQNLIELTTLMITSRGYGILAGEMKKTSVLRHMIEELGPQCIARIEPLDPNLFSLTNEFWVSYFILDQVFDKKFIFVNGSMNKENLSYIPEINLYGVAHT